jgi:hypothetical protein
MHLALRVVMTHAIFPPPDLTPCLQGVSISANYKYHRTLKRKEVRIGRNRKETNPMGGVRTLTPGLEEMILIFWR